MKERIELERGQRGALSHKFGIALTNVSLAMNFTLNSKRARELRSYAVNCMGFKVYLLQKHLI